MQSLFHGTSFEAAQDILKNGFKDADTVWNCSDDNSTYFWSLQRVIELDEISADDDLEYQKHSVITRAFESATIPASLYSTANKIIVLEIEFPDDFEIEPDTSCDNMETSGAVEINNSDVNQYGKIVAIHTADFSPRLSLYYLSGLVKNHYIDLTDYLSQYEIAVCESLNQAGLFIDDLLDFEYDTEIVNKE